MQDANFSGLSELRDVRRELRGIMVTVGLFSVFMNLLMLTGPLFMLQTYDRVLSARSESTLVALVALMAFMFLIMGLLDWARGRLLTRMGARFQARLDRRVFNAILKRSVSDQKIDEKTGSGQQLKDLEAVNRFYASPVFAALFDAPWTPVFLIGLGYFHPWIGAFAGTSLTVPDESGWAVKKDGGQFDQFAGATITPRAVVKAVHQALQYFDQQRAHLLAPDTGSGEHNNG